MKAATGLPIFSKVSSSSMTLHDMPGNKRNKNRRWLEIVPDEA